MGKYEESFIWKGDEKEETTTTWGGEEYDIEESRQLILSTEVPRSRF